MSGRKNGSFRAADGINFSHIRKNVFALHINNYIAFVRAVQEKNAEAVYFSVGENKNTPALYARERDRIILFLARKADGLPFGRKDELISV